MARGPGKNPKWKYKAEDHKHAHVQRNCAHCGKEFLARIDGPGLYCSHRCAGRASNPPRVKVTREGYLGCAKCLKEKPEDEFNRCTKNATGRKSRCRQCQADDHAAIPQTPERKAILAANWQRYMADPENRTKTYARVKKWAKDNPEKARARSQRRSARARAGVVVDFDATLTKTKWDYWAGLCWMCGKDAVEWDHVKPLKAGGLHVLSNLRPACRECNARKSGKWPYQTKPSRQRGAA